MALLRQCMQQLKQGLHLNKAFKQTSVIRSVPVCQIAQQRSYASENKFVDVSVNEGTGIKKVNVKREVGLMSMLGTTACISIRLLMFKGVATVTLQRSPVNSLNLELLQQLNDVLATLEKDKSRGMILTSASPTVFSAGLDILEMIKPKADRVKVFYATLQETWLKLFGSSYPTVAAINGHSPAGGCLLALSCDYRVMVGPKNTIGLNETQLGIVAPKWVQDSMTNVLSKRQAELALVMGLLFTTEEALKIGLIDEMATDKQGAINKAEKFLAGMAKIPATARKMAKLSFRQEPLEWLVANREKDFQGFIGLVNQPAVQEGLELYLASLKKKKKYKTA